MSVESGITLIDGLKMTLLIATLALPMAVIAGSILLFGINSKIKWVSIPLNVIVELIYGIPLIAILVAVYYGFPIFTNNVTSIIILSFAGMADFALFGRGLIRQRRLELNFSLFIRVIIIEIIEIWSRLIKYTAILSIIGVAELFRTAKVLASSSGDMLIYFEPIAIYVLIHMLCRGIGFILTENLLSPHNDLS